MNPREAMQRAVEIFGSQAKLGAAIGFTQTSVHLAVKSGKPSVHMAINIERVTKGAVTANQLRPDVFDEPVFRRSLAG
jgi:DNA-binding transcriptional regulator YdaS (Cro superfamily)